MSEIEKLRLDVNDIKKDMETLIRHDKKFNNSIDNLELIISDLKLTSSIFREQNKNIPERVRCLEDKTIVNELIKTAGWVLLGIFVTAIVQQHFFATKENQDYSIQRGK